MDTELQERMVKYLIDTDADNIAHFDNELHAAGNLVTVFGCDLDAAMKAVKIANVHTRGLPE